MRIFRYVSMHHVIFFECCLNVVVIYVNVISKFIQTISTLHVNVIRDSDQVTYYCNIVLANWSCPMLGTCLLKLLNFTWRFKISYYVNGECFDCHFGYNVTNNAFHFGYERYMYIWYHLLFRRGECKILKTNKLTVINCISITL